MKHWSDDLLLFGVALWCGAMGLATAIFGVVYIVIVMVNP